MASPEETQIKLQWIEINGRNVPLGLPIFWDHVNQRWLVSGTEYHLPVVDEKVKEELELIKQQQADILDRLNEPIPTQLTGSNMELVPWQEIPNGTTFSTQMIDATSSFEIGLGTRARVSGTSMNGFELKIKYFSANKSDNYGEETIELRSAGASRIARVQPRLGYYQFLLINNSGQDDSFKLDVTFFNGGKKI